RALKMHGGIAKDQLKVPNMEALAAGVVNLQRHVRNVEKFGIVPVVAINKFATDTPEELDWLLDWCVTEGVQAAVADVWAHGGGGDGGDALAAKVAAALDTPHRFRHLYPLELSVEDKIRTIVQEVYGADGVDFSVPALRRLAEIEKNGWSGLPVCMAKTQYSFSDDATRLGAPKGFTVHVRDLIPKTGAGFIVALTGAVMTMPGLPKVPAAMRMDVDADGNPVGLF
ncbi:MAG: formate--tetrahydrofolate ligase, partial [Arthrobacter sp.]|nr:formate--tetrahydrofolate ligase [Arthrobacter sp.]